jgi:adenine-specific DNA-methyltransferase
MAGATVTAGGFSSGEVVTEGVKYAGSKRSLLPCILELAGRTGATSVLDGFSGTTRVSQAFAQRGYRVIANDVAAWSGVFATCYLQGYQGGIDYGSLVEHLNNLAPRDGWFTEFYGGEAGDGTSSAGDGLKKPWQVHNTRKLDAIREEIDHLGLLRVERAVALSSLVLALDRVDNTVGHQASYLREWAPRAYKTLELKVPRLVDGGQGHQVCCGDVLDCCDQDVDLAYYDPPYGSNNKKMPPSRVRYASYYHLWTTICLNDRPQLFGKSQRRRDSSDRCSPSLFEEFRRNPETGRFLAVEQIERLLGSTRARWIILSYSSGGRATAEDLRSVILKHGKLVDSVEVDYRRHVMSSMTWTGDWTSEVTSPHREFLFLIENQRTSS